MLAGKLFTRCGSPGTGSCKTLLVGSAMVFFCAESLDFCAMTDATAITQQAASAAHGCNLIVSPHPARSAGSQLQAKPGTGLARGVPFPLLPRDSTAGRACQPPCW